jgi:hypothetical protein
VQDKPRIQVNGNSLFEALIGGFWVLSKADLEILLSAIDLVGAQPALLLELDHYSAQL